VLELLERYRSGERPEGVEQDLSEVSYAPMPKDQHLGIRWSEPRDSIERLVRACSPMLEPFTAFRGERLVVRRVSPAFEGARLAPGELAIDGRTGAVLAGCADGALLLEELEFPAGICLRGARFARLFTPAAGERFERFGGASAGP